LRDELKSWYAREEGPEHQDMIYEVMKDIINQEIPESVINSKDHLWDPKADVLYKEDKTVKFKPEPNTRYQHLLNIFNYVSAMDKYSPVYPTYISRKFDANMEIPQAEVEQLFIDFVSSPQVKKVAELIKQRLGRDLQPYDIWYDGFKSRGTINEDDLDKMTSKLFPDPMAFEKELPVILKKLGWTEEKANFIASKITVDPARGAGHAWGAEMKDDVSHLRTRVSESGMNYKGYNIAMHEFGHNVEQTITLHDVDYYMMNGVPNTAFTEALAFIFQKRDLNMLGINTEDKNKVSLEALDNFWSNYEIMGVSLVDMNVWKWLYENPDADAEQLKNAVVRISKEIWNKYYADVFGIKDQPILAIYSHMIDAPLYLSAYPLGHLIDFQIENQIEGKVFADEVQRIYQQGRLIPQLWMKKAVGMELSNKPIIEAVDKALKNIEE